MIVRLLGGGMAVFALLAGIFYWQWDVTAGKLERERLAHAGTKDAFRQTEANYRRASAEADRLASANIGRVEAEQTIITERTKNDYEARLAATDARYRRLLAQAAAADLGSTEAVPMSLASEATCRAVAGTGCHAIPALLKAAEDNTSQLLALIAWNKAQADVKTNPVEQRP